MTEKIASLCLAESRPIYLKFLICIATRRRALAIFTVMMYTSKLEQLGFTLGLVTFEHSFK